MDSKFQDFVDILKVLLPIYKNDQSKGYIKEIIVRTLRMVESILPMDVSKNAQIVADSMGIGSLYQYGWLKQNKKNGMKDYDRSIFHWEHYVPIQQQLNDLLELKEITDDSIYQIIKKGKICWILKKENAVLDKIARSSRPNPEETYRLAGIELLGERSSFNNKL
jgi:hypothetical protein